MDIRTDDLQVGALAAGSNGEFALPQMAANPAFVETPFVIGIIDRALAYAGEGVPVHFRGPTGCGKTTLAIHLSELLGRPTTILSGEHGYERMRTIDSFIHSLLKTEDRMDYGWLHSRLAVACQQGHTLILDAFNRSRPEINHIFLAALDLRSLILPTIRSQQGYQRVHPDFTAIFTSNPREYAGSQASQDALLDRMITLDLSHFDRDTEVAITQSRTGLPEGQAEMIVDLVRGLREATEGEGDPTVRACIMIGGIMARQSEDGGDLTFTQVCLDVLAKEISPLGEPDEERRQILLDLIQSSGWD